MKRVAGPHEWFHYSSTPLAFCSATRRANENHRRASQRRSKFIRGGRWILPNYAENPGCGRPKFRPKKRSFNYFLRVLQLATKAVKFFSNFIRTSCFRKLKFSFSVIHSKIWDKEIHCKCNWQCQLIGAIWSEWECEIIANVIDKTRGRIRVHLPSPSPLFRNGEK